MQQCLGKKLPQNGKNNVSKHGQWTCESFFQKHPKQMTDLGRYFQNPDCPETGRFPYRTSDFLFNIFLLSTFDTKYVSRDLILNNV